MRGKRSEVKVKPEGVEGNWADVKSSNIKRLRWTRVLEVEFHGGRRYGYLRVPEEVWVQLLGAESHGGYLAANVMGKYDHVQIAGDIVKKK